MHPGELATLEPVHTLIYGPPRSGKSTLAMALALRGFKLIWISLDGGHKIFRKLPKEAWDNLDLIVLKDTRDFPIGIQTVRQLISGEPVTLCKYHGVKECSVCHKHQQPFSSYNFKLLPLNVIVVIDHLTQVTDSCIANICKGKPVDYKLQLDDWGSLRFHMYKLLGDIQHAPFNIIAISQEQEVETEDGTKKIAPAIGSRELGRFVGGYFDHMVYADVVNGKHKFGSASTYGIRVITGSRTDFAIENEKEPSLFPVYKSGLDAPMIESSSVIEQLSLEPPKAANSSGSAEATNLLNKLKSGLKK